MIRTAIALAVLATPAFAEARLQDVLPAVTLSFGNDGATDRAVQTQNDDGAVDLTIFRNVPAPGDAKTAAIRSIRTPGIPAT